MEAELIAVRLVTKKPLIGKERITAVELVLRTESGSTVLCRLTPETIQIKSPFGGGQSFETTHLDFWEEQP